MSQTLSAYALAVSSACGFAYGLGRVPALKKYGFMIPLLATSIANVSNIGFTRVNELIDGAPLFDSDNKVSCDVIYLKLSLAYTSSCIRRSS